MTDITGTGEKKKAVKKRDPCDPESIENMSRIKRASGNYWRITGAIGAVCAVLIVLIIIL
ncbi:hypothetical protein K1W69_00415 [Hoeflea sp. WL0058]|uniref:Uncharacterized protein n=1 Tax=Flavimaribacter sediminis TaxID=2865987 RepID=A0AAE3CZ67_9HYPH|nr:hypothetical protein [Flavimaribacter sediminis]MBW8635632.1 hypothetical protein [Flavimaribacter sediminis]